jgi:hypothetical protein
MVRTVIAICVIMVATFFLPFWSQLLLYAVGIFLVRHHIALLVPALFADAWYAPARNLSFDNNKTVLIVLGMIIVYSLVIRNTRITQTYGLEKK